MGRIRGPVQLIDGKRHPQRMTAVSSAEKNDGRDGSSLSAKYHDWQTPGYTSKLSSLAGKTTGVIGQARSSISCLLKNAVTRDLDWYRTSFWMICPLPGGPG